ncbi:MAG TPA: hypothetical protein VEJ87_10860 [Acidimicrobiales bacterium]|nr:hypothetical protein [Acidimicrobiales bacterium]
MSQGPSTPLVESPSKDEATVADDSSKAPSRAVTITHWLTLACALVVLLVVNRHSWFFADEFDFYNRITSPQTASTWFLPHNEHWSTVPLAIFWVLFHFVQLHSYWPYITTLILIHLALVHLVWRLMLRIGVSGWISTGAATILAVLGAGATNLTWAFQMGFVLSVLFGVWAVTVADNTDPWSGKRLAAVWLLACLSLASSGIGVPMLVGICIVVLVRRGIRFTLIAASVPVVIYAAWYLSYGHKGVSHVDQVTVTKLVHIPSYVWSGMTNALRETSGVPGAGAVLVIALLAYAIWKIRTGGGPTLPAYATLTAGIFALAFISLARGQFGATQAATPRYVYIEAMLFTPMAALGAQEVMRRWRTAGALLVTGAALFVLGNNVYLLWNFTAPGSAFDALEQPFHADLLGAAQLVGTHAVIIGKGIPELGDAPQTSGPFRGDFTLPVTLISKWTEDGDLSSRSANPSGLLAAQLFLQTKITQSPIYPVYPFRTNNPSANSGATQVVRSKGAIRQGSCFVIPHGAELTLRTTRPTSLGVDGLPTSTTTLSLLSGTGFSGPGLLLSSSPRRAYVDMSRTGALTIANYFGSNVSVCSVS